MEPISPHISYKEATRCEIAKRMGWKNDPDSEQLKRIKTLAEKVFEPIRKYFGIPIFIWSMFRTKQVNEAINGAKNSQHMANNGAAIDIDAQVYGVLTNKRIFDYVRKNLEFDQLIGEGISDGDFDWIHVSYNEGKNRKEILTMISIDGKPTYQKFQDL